MVRRASLIAVLLCAQAAQAQYFFPQDRQPWMGPDQRYAIEIPPGWQVYVDEKDPTTVELRPAEATGDASLFIRRIDVPKGASPKQLRLIAIEQRLRKLPSWKEMARRDARLGPSLAAAVAGVYYFQGNAQFPRAVEEVYIIDGSYGYVFHFECFEPLAPSFAADLDRLYKSFILDPPQSLGALDPPNPYEPRLPVDTDRVQY